MEETVKKPVKTPSRRPSLLVKQSVAVLILRYLEENPGIAHRRDIRRYLFENGGFVTFNGPARFLLDSGIIVSPRPAHFALAPDYVVTPEPEADDTPPTTATP